MQEQASSDAVESAADAMKSSRSTSYSVDRIERDREELAGRIEQSTRVDGQHATALPALTFFRASAPGAQVCGMYEPGLALVAQGAKQLQLGDEIYRYDQANYLLTSIDLPVSSQVMDATPDRPYLCAMLR